MHFFNEIIWISIYIALKIFPAVQLTKKISLGAGNGLALNLN